MADNNNLLDGFGEGLRKVFLAGVGAMATTAEKGHEIINDLVKKGELTVEQGKTLNSELAHKADDAKGTLKDQTREAAETVKNAASGLRETVRRDVEEDRKAVHEDEKELKEDAKKDEDR